MTIIPKGDYDTPGPCWIPCSTAGPDPRPLKPVIKCQCQNLCGIRLHRVALDGTVTASFFHTPECDPGRGCGWHVFLKLADYDGPEFLPHEGQA